MEPPDTEKKQLEGIDKEVLQTKQMAEISNCIKHLIPNSTITVKDFPSDEKQEVCQMDKTDQEIEELYEEGDIYEDEDDDDLYEDEEDFPEPQPEDANLLKDKNVHYYQNGKETFAIKKMPGKKVTPEENPKQNKELLQNPGMNISTLEELTRFKKKQKELNDTLEEIYLNNLDYPQVEDRLFNPEFLGFLEEVSKRKKQERKIQEARMKDRKIPEERKEIEYKGLDYLLTEILRKASEYLSSKSESITRRAHVEENNNHFLNEVNGKIKGKMFAKTVRQAYSSIIIQNPTSSIIQQFREAPSAYIFFVHELIQAFIDICNSSTMLYKIFDKLKKHFWADTPGGVNSSPLQNNIKDKVNVETEHLALFYYHILRENATRKIMKSAKQTLEDDKITLQEYKIFITIIEIYKKVYLHCKN